MRKTHSCVHVFFSNVCVCAVRMRRMIEERHTFHKSAEVAGQVDENLPGHVSSSTPAAYEAYHAARDDLWVQISTDDEPYFWHRVEQTAVWRMPPGTRPAWLRVHEGLFFHIETETVQHSLSGTF